MVFRGRVGDTITPAEARAAARLATRNALAAARAAVGPLARLSRCLVLTCFVDAAPGSLHPGVLSDALAVLTRALGLARPVVWLRPAQSLAGRMPVEVELLLELAPRPRPPSDGPRGDPSG